MNKDKKEKVRDPVCGMVKPKGEMRAISVFKGKVYYFCTEGDKQVCALLRLNRSLHKNMFEAHQEYWIPKR